MASIFNKAPKEPPYKQALQETENSILKRLNTFIDETTNKFKSTNDWIKKTGEQVNELLKRTFDLQRKVEGQMIELENKTKQSILDYDNKIEKFEDHIEEKFATNDRFDEIGANIVSGLKKLDKKINRTDAKADDVRREIPTNVVKKAILEEVVSELRSNLDKIANAIPKNVASNDLVADVRRELMEMFDPYATIEAVKSVERKNKSEVEKVARAAAKTSQESKDTVKEFNKLASKVNDIKDDYVPAKMVPQIRQEMTQGNLQLTDLINEVEKKIPTDYATVSEINVLREFQRDINTRFDDHKTEQSKEISTTMLNIEQIMSRTSKTVDDKIKSFESTLAETTMGEDTNFMKNIIREIADEEIKQLRNSNTLFQENVKNNIIEMKNQNRNLANKVVELQGSFDKLIKLAQNK